MPVRFAGKLFRMKEVKTPQPRSVPQPAHVQRPFFSKENAPAPFFSRPTAPIVQRTPATGAQVIQRSLDWDADKMERLAGGKSFRSEEYKNILRAIKTYKEVIEPGRLPDDMKVDRLYELQGYAITWLEKHKNDTDATVERRRQAIEDFAYRSIIREITRLSGEYNEGKSLGVVGKGQISELTAVDYDVPGGEVEKRFFKPNEESFDKGASSAVDSGIPSQRALLSNRAVATSALDNLFGLGATVPTDFAFDPGKPAQFGIAMGIAPGLSPQMTHVEKAMTPDSPDTETHFYREFQTGDVELQKQLSTLQLFDAITGQVDRHPGNYFIKQEGGGTLVTGIDNDFSFGKTNTDVSKGSSPASKYQGFPAYVQRSVAQKIRSKSESDIRKVLRPLLPPKEVDATVLRFQGVLQQLDALEKQGHLLDEGDWDHMTAQNQNADTYFGLLNQTLDEKRDQGKTFKYDPKEDPKARANREKNYSNAYATLFSLLTVGNTELAAGNYPPGFKAKDKPTLKQEVKKLYHQVLKENINIVAFAPIQMRVDYILNEF